MNHKKSDKVSKKKNDAKDLSFLKENSTISNMKSNKTKFLEMSSQIQTIMESNKNTVEGDECQNNAIYKMSLKMNHKNKVPITSTSFDKNNSKICKNCKNRTKLNYKNRFQVSIKSKKCSRNDGSSDNEPVLKPDILLHFLEKMRKMVSKRDLEFGTLRIISEKLIKDDLNVEVLLLMDLIIRFQVGELKDLIFTDLLSIEILPENFVKAFLKQYILLKRISHEYNKIMKDFEYSFLSPRELTFDLICRAHFKIHLYDSCREIQDLIDAGHLDVKEELILDIDTENTSESIKNYYAQMKADFKFNSKWKDVQKNVENILSDPYEISRSLLKYFNNNLSSLFKSDYCPHHHQHQHYHRHEHMSGNGSSGNKSSTVSRSTAQQHNYLCPNHPNHALHCTSHKHQHQQLYHKNSVSNKSGGNIKVCDSTTQIKQSVPIPVTSKMNCSNLYRQLDNVKPPSLSSSSTNSNEYNSCASTSSSSDDSSDMENNSITEISKIVANGGASKKVVTHNKGNSINSLRSRNIKTTKHKARHKSMEVLNSTLSRISYCEFVSEKCDSDNITLDIKKSLPDPNKDDFSEDIIAFNKLYETYLKGNKEFLSEKTAGEQKLSIPDCIKNLESADNFKNILNILVSNCSKTMNEPISKKDSNLACVKEDVIRCGNQLNGLSLQEMAEYSCDDDSTPEHMGIEIEDLTDPKRINDNLLEVEHFLEQRAAAAALASGTDESDSHKFHPNVKALIKNCRIYHNKIFNPSECGNGRLTSDNDELMLGESDMDDDEDADDEGNAEGDIEDDVDEDDDDMDDDEDDDNCEDDDDDDDEGKCPGCVEFNRNSVSDECNNGSGSLNDTVTDKWMESPLLPKCSIINSGKYIHTDDINGNGGSLESESSTLINGLNSNGNATNSNNVANKVCKCCKCEMFGDGLSPLNPSVRGLGGPGINGSGANHIQRLRRKLQKRKEQQAAVGGNNNNCQNYNECLPDVDSLVKFINGDDDSENQPTHESPVATRKSKSKNKSKSSGKSSSKKILQKFINRQNTSTTIETNTSTNIGSNNVETNTNNVNSNSSATVGDNVYNNQQSNGNNSNQTPRKNNKTKIDRKISQSEVQRSQRQDTKVEECDDDPVVESFKQFCDQITVVPMQRKKLAIDPNLLMTELQKCQKDTK